MATIIRTDTGMWRARVRKNGARSLSKNFPRKADAEAWARKEESSIERGLWHDNQAAERCTLRDALERYEAEVTPGKRSATSERSTLAIIRADASFIDLGLARVGSPEIARLRDQWKRDGVRPATIKRRMALLSHLFTVASREWGMPALVNPVHNVSFEPVSDARDRRVSDEEIEAICEASESQELAAFVRLAVATGMRRGELVSLRWKDVDLNRKVARVVTKSKVKGRTRDVPLLPVAVDALNDMARRIDGRVFGGRPDTFTQAFVRATQRARAKYATTCQESGEEPDVHFLAGVRLHDLRHEAASRFAKKLQAHELAKVMGHLTLQMVMRYYNPTPEELVQKMAKL